MQTLDLLNPMWLLKKKRPKILIVGVGKSGTSFLFHLIKNNLPFSEPPHTLFEPNELKNVSGIKRCVLVKLNLSLLNVNYNGYEQFDKRILLIRDPRDLCVSSILYEGAYHRIWHEDIRTIESLRSLLIRKTEKPESVTMTEIAALMSGSKSPNFFRDNLKKRLKFFVKFYRQSNGFVILRYKDLISENLNDIEAYLDFKLNFSAGDSADLKRVKRSATAGDWKLWFTKDDMKLFNTICEDYAEAFGYRLDELPPAVSDEVIQPAHAHEYVMSLINQQRCSNGFEAVL